MSKIVLNGTDYELPEQKLNLMQLLSNLHRKPDTVVVEHNGQLYRKADFDQIYLENNDKVEVIHFMGGG